MLRARLETLEANRVKSALAHRSLVYKELSSVDQVLLYHKNWLEQAPLSRSSQVTPDPATLDSRGDDLPLDKLHALATQSQVKTMAVKAAAAMDGDRGLLHVDRYVYWYDTKAPPADWNDVLPHLIGLHEVTAGFLLADLGLAPKSRAASGSGYTWLTGFVDEQWAHYLKYALDSTLTCSTYMMDPAPWLLGHLPPTSRVEGSCDRLVGMHNGIRQFRRFPNEEPAIAFRTFFQPINPQLVEQVAQRYVLLTVIDHTADRRSYVPQLVAKILRNRNKTTNPLSKSKGLNYYVPAIQGLRKERDESQRLHFVKGIQARHHNPDVPALLQMPLNELRVKFWTIHQPTAPSTAAPAAAAAPAPAPAPAGRLTPPPLPPLGALAPAPIATDAVGPEPFLSMMPPPPPAAALLVAPSS